jgi:N-acetylglucosamine repressor
MKKYVPFTPDGKRARAVPTTLRRMNARIVLETMRRIGPCSRADLCRETGISAPTLSKLIVRLEQARLVESPPNRIHSGGRPGQMFRLARESVQIIGIVVDVATCTVVTAGMDGQPDPDRILSFPTPKTYSELLARCGQSIQALRGNSDSPCLGVGLSIPGMIDLPSQQVILSTNLPCLNGKKPGVDIEKRTGLPTRMSHNMHGLCLAERFFGLARGLQDFALLDLINGLGLGVVSGGRYLDGSCGFGGEIGHIIADPKGVQCGCGKHGCLETLATDAALRRLISARLGRQVTMDEIIRFRRSGQLDGVEDFDVVLNHLASGLSIIINLFNPEVLFVYGRMFDADDQLFDQLVRLARGRALQPSLERCRIVRGSGNKHLGALTVVLEHYLRTIGPRMGNP